MSSFSKTSRVYAVLIIVLLAILAASNFMAPVPPSPIASFDNPGPQGLLALRLVLEQIPNLDIEITKGSPGQPISLKPAQSLIIAEPAVRSYEHDEAQNILEQVKAGARLVLLYNGHEGESAVGLRAFSKALGIKIRDISPDSPKTQAGSGIMAEVQKLDDYVFSVFDELPDGAISLAEVPKKGSVLIAMRYGRGHVLAMSHLQFFNNGHLADDDNARLAVQLLAPHGYNNLHIDETHHLALTGTHMAKAFSSAPFRAFAFSLALAALLFALNRRRRGQLRRPVNSPGFHAEANARALASLYRDSADIDGLNQRLRQLAEAHGIDLEFSEAKNLTQWQIQMKSLLRRIKA